MAFDRSIFD